jgi:hypothetical protein
MDLILTLATLYPEVIKYEFHFNDINPTLASAFYKYVGKLITLDCTRKPSSRIAIYGMSVTDHSSRSVEGHRKKMGANPTKRIIGYITRAELERMKKLYMEYGIQDAPLTYDTRYHAIPIFDNLQTQRYVEYIARKYSDQESILMHQTRVYENKENALSLNNVVSKHKDDAFYIIPYIYTYGIKQQSLQDKIFSRAHQVVVLLCNKTLLFIDSNCSMDSTNELAVLKLEGIAKTHGLQFMMPFHTECILQKCESLHDYTKIDRSGYCVIWSLLTCEILAKHAQRIIAGTTPISELLSNTFAHMNRPALTRKIVVDYMYSLYIRTNKQK